MGRLPDLRFQNVNIETKIQKSFTDFMDSNEFLGLLIGPTGCGKSHEMIRRAKMEFTIFIDARSHQFSNKPIDSYRLFSMPKQLGGNVRLKS
jgi:ABC-type cobalamin transport system ATPase subunit